MKKVLFSIFAAVAIMVTLPAHTVVKSNTHQASGSLFRVTVFFTGANAAYGFYLYATNANTGEFYEFDYYENSFLLPAGTYYFGGEDASGSGWCGIGGTQATINCDATVPLDVWCE